jgi:hypothetical protein
MGMARPSRILKHSDRLFSIIQEIVCQRPLFRRHQGFSVVSWRRLSLSAWCYRHSISRNRRIRYDCFWEKLSKRSVFSNISSCPLKKSVCLRLSWHQNNFIYLRIICYSNWIFLDCLENEARRDWKKSRFKNHWKRTNPDSFHKFTRIPIYSAQNRHSHL